ncbi:glycosyltransferase family 4 protein [Haloarcula sp. H-GB5]
MKESLNVLLAPGIFPPDSGGPATFVSSLGRELVNRGHSVRVVTNGRASSEFDDQYPFKVVRIPRGNSVVSRYARQIRTLVVELRSYEPDVMLVNAFDLQATTAGRIVGVPTVSKIVGDSAWERARRSGETGKQIKYFQQFTFNPKLEGWKLLRTAPVRLADHVAVPSEFLRSLVTGWGVDPDETSVIYNAIDIDRPSVADSNRPPRIVTVGRLVPWKGIGGIIDAFQQTDVADAELHIVGDGPERNALEARASQQGVGDQVVFHGRIPHEQVLEIVSRSRVFALNSTYEGLPHVVLEAMACGTPVVASAVCGTPEVITDGEDGFLVPQDDVESFSKRFEQLLSKPSVRDQLRAQAYKRLESQFEHEKMVAEYETLLREVASTRGCQ